MKKEINYYKLGRTSSRESRLSSYAHEYDLPKSKIQFLYEIEIENEKFAEKFLFYLLDEYRINNSQELFKVDLKTIKDAMNNLKIILVNFPKPKNQEIILDNFDNLINSESQDDEDNKYILSIINGDYEIIQKTKIIKQINAKFECKYCNQHFTRKPNMERHIREACKVKKELDKLEKEKQDRLEKEKKDELQKKKKDENKQFEILLKTIEEQNKQFEILLKFIEEQKNEHQKFLEKREEEHQKFLEKREEEQRKFMEQMLNKMNQTRKDEIKKQVKEQL